MKPLFLASLLLLSASSIWAQTTVNAGAKASGNVQSVTISFLNPQNAGDTNIITVHWCYAVGCNTVAPAGFGPSVNDTATTMYNPDCMPVANGVNAIMYRGFTSAAVTNAVTVSFPSAVAYVQVFVNEQKGTWYFDGCGKQYVKGPGIVSIPAQNAVTTGDLVYGWLSGGTTTTTTAGTGFTLANQLTTYSDEVGIPAKPVATFNYASATSALGIMAAYKSTPPLAANMNFTANVKLLWDDGTPVSGTLQALQWQNGTMVLMTPNTGLDATGAASLPVTVNTTAQNTAGWLRIIFDLLDANGNVVCQTTNTVCVQMQQDFPPQMLAAIPPTIPVTLKLSKSSYTLVSWSFN